MTFLLLAFLLPAELVELDNAYLHVARNATVCAEAPSERCGDRVIVVLGDLTLRSGNDARSMKRGDIAVFVAGEAHEPPVGSYFEVAIRPEHPPVQSPTEMIPPEKNAMRYEGERFFVFEERLEPGDTRARHSHSQRVVIQLNRTRLQQWPDGRPMFFVETVPDRAVFSPPVIHVVKNVGEAPLRGIVIEFKPERTGGAAMSR